MEYTIPIRIESLDDGYAATSEKFPGFLAHGKTFEETIRKAEIVLKSLLETYRDKGVNPKFTNPTSDNSPAESRC